MNRESEVIILKKKVEEKYGAVPGGPDAFDRLAETISEDTRERISVSTLKRMWGYIGTTMRQRESSLDILARYVGYSRFREFCNDMEKTSAFLTDNIIDTGKLAAGCSVILKWDPDRVVRLSYEGEQRFTVTDPGTSKLAAGDSFRCGNFIKGQALHIAGIQRAAELIPAYVAGKTNGLTEVEIIPLQ